MDLSLYYKEIINLQGNKSSSLKRKIFNVGTARLIVFLATILSIYLFWGQVFLLFLFIIAGIIFFLALLLYHNMLYVKKDYCDTQVKLAEDELKGLVYDYTAFDGGGEFLSAEHSFSYDLDLFGEKSVFQSINRTVSVQGKTCLAQIMQHPLDTTTAIFERQQAVKELKEKHKTLFHFRTLGSVSSEKKKLNEKPILNDIPTMKAIKFWQIMSWFVPAAYLVLFVLWLCNLLPGEIFLPIWFVSLFISLLPSKSIKSLIDFLNRGDLVPPVYADLIEVIEHESFDSLLLKNIQATVCEPDKASVSLKKLKKYKNNLELAFTFPILLILNPYLLWNVRYSVLIYRWLNENKVQLEAWQKAVAEFDALVSLATYSFNHPDFVYPQPENEFVFEGEDLGHPLINEAVSVKNNACIPQNNYFLVVTGANMAGKSTFLRTVGVNHVLACVGTVVCAKSLRFSPAHLITNLRTSDSLNDNESYFFAELKRLKMIIDRLHSGEKLFIILDEILKGTNSEDKRKGSMALMRQLVALNSNGIIATHDLVLGKLATEFPENVKNYCFEAEIKTNKLIFSYKIREGIAQNMNASFLMKQMGITGL